MPPARPPACVVMMPAGCLAWSACLPAYLSSGLPACLPGLPGLPAWPARPGLRPPAQTGGEASPSPSHRTAAVPRCRLDEGAGQPAGCGLAGRPAAAARRAARTPCRRPIQRRAAPSRRHAAPPCCPARTVAPARRPASRPRRARAPGTLRRRHHAPPRPPAPVRQPHQFWRGGEKKKVGAVEGRGSRVEGGGEKKQSTIGRRGAPLPSRAQRRWWWCRSPWWPVVAAK